MNFPCKRWMVQPAGKVVEVTVVGQAYGSATYSDWMKLESGKAVHMGNLFENAEAALLQRKTELESQQIKLDKQQANLTKKMRKVCDEITRVRIARGEGPPNPFEK